MTAGWPPAPTNVRVDLQDGRVIPLELVCDGFDADGVAVWTNPVPIRVPAGAVAEARVRVGFLPAGCRVGVRYR